MSTRPTAGPVSLHEDPDTGDRFLLYGTTQGVTVELRYAGEELWLSQKGMAELFGVTVPTINEHLKGIFADGELAEAGTIRNFRMVRPEGSRQVAREVRHYSLNAVISVGYRISSKQGTLFRIWATDKLVQFATKGFVVDARRLKDPGEQDRLRELREIIRDIRSDEANLYREVRRICSMCQDYDARSTAWREFSRRMQAKLTWAVTSQTPAMILTTRADAEAENMGLQTWSAEEIRQQDALVAKNYLSAAEIKELNRVTSILLDIFEDQIDIGKLTLMSAAEAMLDTQLRSLSRSVLTHGGNAKHEAAEQHAKEQYRRYDLKRRALREAQADADLAALLQSAGGLPRSRRKRKPTGDG